MAKHRGRGFATIEYPTGMNQNGDPSQAWIKLKPDGRVDVFSGTVDIGQGSKTVHTQIVADALGVPYDWVTMDNTNTDSSAVCTGTFASRGTFIGGNAVRLAAERVRERILDIASKELEIDASDLEIADGEVTREGRAAEDDQRRRRRRRRDLQLRRADQRLVDGAEAVRRRRRRDRPGRDRAALGDLVRRVRRGGRGRRRDRRGRRAEDGAGLRRRPRDQPDARRGADRGRRDHGPRARARSRASYPYYPSAEHRGGEFGAYLGPALRGPAGARQRDPREPVRGRPVRREGDRRDGEQRAAAGDRERDLRRGRRLDHRDAGDAGARARGARGEARAAPRRQARDLRRADLGEDGLRRTAARASSASMPELDARSAPGTAATSWEFVDGVRLHAIGGEQVLLCRVQLRAGQAGAVARARGHRAGDVHPRRRGRDDDRGRDDRRSAPGDVVVVNRGLHHKLFSESGVTFMEALAPVPLDHVPDRELDLVLGPDGGAQHVEQARCRSSASSCSSAG